MRLLLDRGVPKGGRRQILPPWKEIVPLGIELRWPNAILLPRHPGNGPHPQVLQPDRLAGGSCKTCKIPVVLARIHPTPRNLYGIQGKTSAPTVRGCLDGRMVKSV